MGITVEELIEMLQQCPQSYTIAFKPKDDFCKSLRDITYHPDKDNVIVIMLTDENLYDTVEGH